MLGAPLQWLLGLACGVGFAAVESLCPAGAGAALAGDTPVQAYSAAAPDCLAWTDGCVTCARDVQAKTHCSTPGFACLPVAVTCRVSKRSP